METNVYKPIIKNFMEIGEVRVIQDGRNEYVVLKDVFNCLGLVKEGGIWSEPKQKTLEFLDIIEKKEDCQSLAVLVKQGKIKTK